MCEWEYDARFNPKIIKKDTETFVNKNTRKTIEDLTPRASKSFGKYLLFFVIVIVTLISIIILILFCYWVWTKIFGTG